MRKYRHVVTDPCNLSLYSIRQNMIRRCYDPKCDRYKDYGGRGITICQEWLDDFDAFADWAYENGYEYRLTIDRIDVNENYEPNNCRWLTNAEQQNNKRQSLWIEYKGERKTLHTWCQELNLPYDATHNRITKGWDVEKAFTEPLFDPNKSFSKLCREHNINPATAHDRIKKLGWTLEDALNIPSLGRTARPRKYAKQAICVICGSEYTKTTGKQKYCSEKCHNASKRKEYKTKLA